MPTYASLHSIRQSGVPAYDSAQRICRGIIRIGKDHEILPIPIPILDTDHTLKLYREICAPTCTGRNFWAIHHSRCSRVVNGPVRLGSDYRTILKSDPTLLIFKSELDVPIWKIHKFAVTLLRFIGADFIDRKMRQ